MPEQNIPDVLEYTGASVSANEAQRRQRIIPIDQTRSVQTSRDQKRSELIDLVESQKSGRVLSGIVQGRELNSDASSVYAVVYHGSYKVIIPAEEMIPLTPENQHMQIAHVTKRLGAEIDYVVAGIDVETGVAAGSRLEAMAIRQRELLRTNHDGAYEIQENDLAEARVVSVIRSGIFVELFGLEIFVPLSELSYQRWLNSEDHFVVGQRILVQILTITRDDAEALAMTVSVKRAAEESFLSSVARYKVNDLYIGTVSMITTSGVFVSLDGVDCLCRFPRRGRPPIGTNVTVKILGIDSESKRIWGVIVH